MIQFKAPFPQFFALSGLPLNNGSIYIGQPSLNPETNPIQVYWDVEGTIPAAQPLRTSSGYIVRNGTPSLVYSESNNYSLTVRDHNGSFVYTFGDVSSVSDVQAFSVINFGATGNGTTNDAAAVLLAASSAGPTGVIFFPPGTYLISSCVIECGGMEFAPGAILVPEPGAEVIIAAEIYAGDWQIFNTGKLITACDCNSGSMTLRGWNYGFEAADVGEPICLRYGGALTGPAPVGNFVQNREPFNTTVAAYTDANTLTLLSAPITAIRQDYVIDAGFDFLNTGIVIIGNGTVEFSPRVTTVNAAWFGSDSTGHALNKASFSLSRRYGGTAIWLPNGTYTQNVSMQIDVPNVTLKSNPRLATLFRANSVALERMNNITTVWRSRYGGGGPTKVSENWTFGSPTPLWQGDWHIMSGLILDGIMINGNSANQPTLTPGSGLDSWDAGFSALYTARILVKSNCTFVNCLRWGVALSTLSHDGVCEDGVYFENCAEGAFYVETSNRIVCGAIVAIGSPVAGWNMGAVTYLTVNGGVIKAPITSGCNNGIYIRTGSQNIDIDVGSHVDCNNNAVWVLDETLGSNRLKNITIRGGSISGSKNGVDVSYCDRISISDVKGLADEKGITVEHCSQFNVESNSVNGSTYDIQIKAGTTFGTVANNAANVELTGTSTTNLTVEMVQGYTFTNTASGTGYLTIIERINFSDGNGRHKFGSGGIQMASSVWNTYPLDFNGKVMWVDSTNKLRMKNGYPVNETDGVQIVQL